MELRNFSVCEEDMGENGPSVAIFEWHGDCNSVTRDAHYGSGPALQEVAPEQNGDALVSDLFWRPVIGHVVD